MIKAFTNKAEKPVFIGYLIHAALICLILGYFAPYQALSQSKPKPRKRLSQLMFDQGSKKNKADATPSELLEVMKKKAIKRSPTQNSSSSSNEVSNKLQAVGKLALSRNAVKFNNSKPMNIDAGLIIPQVKTGPQEDKGRESVITSKHTWARGGSSTCKTPGRVVDICEKSLAMKELLNRFTGNDDFYDFQCSGECPSKDEVMVMEDMQLESNEIYTLRILDEVKACRYRWTKPRSTNWKILQSKSFTCACVPAECQR